MSELLVSALEPGIVLAERFVVRLKLGDGAAASVYRATDTRTDRDVALKILDPLRGADPVGRLRFARELEILSRVEHPAIARCLQHVTHDGLDILVLELIEGETLAQRVARGPLPVREAVAIATQAAEALDACHRVGVIHRDLSPANIMLHPERGAVLLDFGVAWFSSAANLTRTGAVVGSPQYIAPEVFHSSLADARADVYALGVILYELLAGHPPYRADSVPALLEQARRGPPPSLLSLRPEVGVPLSKAVARALAHHPESRYASALELRRALLSDTALPGRALVERLPCARCQVPLVIDLPLCPGCGAPVSWQLEPGAHAVQLLAVPDPARAAAWLRARYGYALPGGALRLVRRLSQLPVPLIVDASEASAIRLVTEARELGMDAEVIQAHSVSGARLRIADATFVESIASLVLHYAGALTLGGLLALAGARLEAVMSVPAATGLLALLAARAYTRRPILRVRATQAALPAATTRELSERLGGLQNDRSRRLAAAAVSRAAPVLLGDTAGLATQAPADALDALGHALTAVTAADAQLTALLRVPRARLGAELVAARGRVERQLPGAAEAVVALERDQAAHLEAAVAHDLAVREALDATEAIARALATRTHEVPSTRWPEP